MSAPAWSAVHRRRLRALWRSAGWPCRDTVELELLAGGLLKRHVDPQGRETLHLSEAGLALAVATLDDNRRRRAPHEALVARVAEEMQRAGRVVWCGLSLRAPLPAEDGTTRWALAMPDVYSIRHTTREDAVEPVAHEIKVRRADLLADLRRPEKAAAYHALASQCWYVLAAGIADPEEIPPAYGVLLAPAQGGLVLARPAPRRARVLPFAVWMALARSAPLPAADDGQALLADADAGGDTGCGDAPGSADFQN